MAIHPGGLTSGSESEVRVGGPRPEGIMVGIYVQQVPGDDMSGVGKWIEVAKLGGRM